MPAASFDGVNIQSCHLHFSGGSTKLPAQPGQACSTSRCQAEPNTEAEARQRNLGRLGHGEAGKVRPEKNARAEKPGKFGREISNEALNHLDTKPQLFADPSFRPSSVVPSQPNANHTQGSQPGLTSQFSDLLRGSIS